jgi:hypothetical protein
MWKEKEREFGGGWKFVIFSKCPQKSGRAFGEEKLKMANRPTILNPVSSNLSDQVVSIKVKFYILR